MMAMCKVAITGLCISGYKYWMKYGILVSALQNSVCIISISTSHLYFSLLFILLLVTL